MTQEQFDNLLLVWDLDLEDSMFHMRATARMNRVVNTSAMAAALLKGNNRHLGRFVVMAHFRTRPGEVHTRAYKDLNELTQMLQRVLSNPEDNHESMHITVYALLDAVSAIDQLRGRLRCQIEFAPQMDGTKLR